MGPALTALVIAALAGQAPPAARFDLGREVTAAWTAAWQLAAGPVKFRRKEREVTNWRYEAATNLAAALPAAAALLGGQTPANLPRCIKLNNYWCIKRAGWAGEIASDEEGHVGFSSASEGAQTAALLLRRYYVDFGRKSAYSIVSRWAPASCGYVGGRGGAIATDAGRRRVGKLARSAVGGTLRARWLAAHGGRVAGGPAAASGMRRSVVRDYAIPLMRAPTIEAGIAEAPSTGTALAGASLAGLAVDAPAPRANRGAPGTTTASKRPNGAVLAMSCGSENQRIANYAARASAGITTNPNDDLQLFTADGSPLPNLEKIMLNMASVEIGPYRADRGFIVAAIAKANELRLAALAAKKAAAQAASTVR